MTDAPILSSNLVVAGLILLAALWVLAAAGVALHVTTGRLAGPVSHWPFAQIAAWARRGFRRRPAFVFGECPECGFTLIGFDPAWLARYAGFPADIEGSLECPRCLGEGEGEGGRQVFMTLRPARAEDVPKGLDLRAMDDDVLAGVVEGVRQTMRDNL